MSLFGKTSNFDKCLAQNSAAQKQEESHLSPSNQNRNSPVPSAPATSLTMIGNNGIYSPSKLNDTSPSENGKSEIGLDQFKSNLESTLEIFENRMKNNSSRGRPISNDTFVQSLFMNKTNMNSQLVKHIQDSEDRTNYFEGLQDKIAQIRDARAALDALREEHREKLRREAEDAEEAERLRRIQMAQKLDIMRKKKQEYLQYQRQVSMQRIQGREREMQLRQEQHNYQLGFGRMMSPQRVPHYQHQMPPGQVPYMPAPSQGQPGPYQVGRGPASPQHHMGGPSPQQYGPQPFQNQPTGSPQPPPQVVGPPHYRLK